MFVLCNILDNSVDIQTIHYSPVLVKKNKRFWLWLLFFFFRMPLTTSKTIQQNTCVPSAKWKLSWFMFPSVKTQGLVMHIHTHSYVLKRSAFLIFILLHPQRYFKHPFSTVRSTWTFYFYIYKKKKLIINTFLPVFGQKENFLRYIKPAKIMLKFMTFTCWIIYCH